MLSIPRLLQVEELKEVNTDKELGEIVAYLQAGQSSKARYSQLNGLLLYKGRVVLPKSSPWVTIVLKECHDTNVGGHSRFLKTYK